MTRHRPRPDAATPVKPKRRRRWLARLATWIGIVAVWGLIVVGVVVAWYAADLPDIDDAIAATRRPSVTVLAADGSELATAGDLYGIVVRVQDMPPALPLATMAIEDRRFRHHAGIDPVGLTRAAVANLRAKAVVEGGSTITQQVAKNLFLSPERTVKRKVQEVLLALWLERRLSKNQILALYLNRAYFGAGAYGVDAAARKYFGVPASRVSTYQAAMLAGLLKAPSRYNPFADAEAAASRTRQVLAAMVDAEFLTEGEAAVAERYPGRLLEAGAGTRAARYFVDWVLDQVPELTGTRDRDLVVTTTLDVGLQRLAEDRMAAVLAADGGKSKVGQVALVAMTPDGAIRAMIGGRDYRASQFNRATQALRQPGSAFKPVVYLAGLEGGLTPDSSFVDAPISIGAWRPKNFDGRYRGEMTLRRALSQSINTVAVQVGEYAGRRRVIDVARRLGISSELTPTPSLSLGVAEVSLLELTGAYAVLANGGYGVWPHAIETVRDSEGRLLYRHSGGRPGRVVQRGDVADITDMLVEVIHSGTGRRAALSRPAAGKTGTSQNFRDAWFVGFTADLVTGVWMGNDDGDETRGVVGGSLPARAWRAFMADAHDGAPPRQLAGLEPAAESPAPASRPAPRSAQPDIIEWLIDKLTSAR